MLAVVCLGLAGCANRLAGVTDELAVRDTIERYQAAQMERLGQHAAQSQVQPVTWFPRPADPGAGDPTERPFALGVLWQGTFSESQPAGSQPTGAAPVAGRPALPEGYWREDIWHQMGHEALDLGSHDFWRGFKTSFWNVPNAVVLTATYGASIAIRETGVDDTIADRVHHHRKLGQYDDTIQILGYPGTHFAGAGLLWLGSALLQDAKEHEVAKSLVQALAVTGVSTLVLKTSTNTSSPDGDRFGWPSGHTSSAFAAAAVLNEYYGPWVGVPSLALAGLVGYQRIDSRVHDFSDVVFGAMLGYVVGTSIAHENKTELPQLFGMTIVPYVDPESGTTGLALLKQW